MADSADPSSSSLDVATTNTTPEEQAQEFLAISAGPSSNTDKSCTNYDLKTDLDVPLPDFLFKLQANPGGVARALHDLVEAYAVFSPESDPHVPECLETLIVQLNCTLVLPASQVGSRVWCDLLDSGLCDTITDLILQNGFFRESKVGTSAF